MKKIKYSEITPEKIYKNRRSFIKSIGLSAGSIAMTSFLCFIKINYYKSFKINFKRLNKKINTYL